MKKLNLSDIVFIAIITAVFLLLSGIIAPFIMTSSQLGLQGMAMSFTTALFYTIGLRKVPKAGALTLGGIFSGLFLMLMTPVLFFNQFIGAILAEGFALLVKRNFSRKVNISLATASYGFFTIPTTGLINYFVRGKDLAQQIGNPIFFIFLIVLSLVLGYIGAKIGHKLADTLEEAGKL